jgi:dihydrofolate reductase
MRISIIAAVARNGVIGADGNLPWRLADDLRLFKKRTMGHHLVMGRKTWESVGALPGRTTIVLSSRSLDLPTGVEQARSLDDAFSMAKRSGEEELFVAGGGVVYRAALARVDRIYLTRVDAAVAGDTTFPPLDEEQWHPVATESYEADARNEHGFEVVVLDRLAL